MVTVKYLDDAVGPIPDYVDLNTVYLDNTNVDNTIALGWGNPNNRQKMTFEEDGTITLNDKTYSDFGTDLYKEMFSFFEGANINNMIRGL